MSELDEMSLEQIEELLEKVEFLEELVEDITFESLLNVINYYEKMLKMNVQERKSEIYGLMSTYGLLLLNSTYDAAIKDIFNRFFSNSLQIHPNIKSYLSNFLKANVTNHRMSNIRHDKIKKDFTLEDDKKDNLLKQSVSTIEELVKTRNSIAHGLSPSEKGHDDLYRGLKAVIYYLSWYSNQLNQKFQEQ